MPELPEVEVVRRGLADHVVGSTIDRAQFLGSRVARRHVPGPGALADEIAGRRVLAARRRGKYLWLELDGDGPGHGEVALVIHLGMSGQLRVAAPGSARDRHTHAVLALRDGPELRFVDQRTFGGFALAPLAPDPAVPVDPGATGTAVPTIPQSITHIAPDPFEAVFDLTTTVRAIRRRDSAIKRVLLDQQVLSGIGNIYADESLWRARIHPERPARALPAGRVADLLEQARGVMAQALEAGGTSFDRLYVNVNGRSGYFERSLQVYGRTGQPCPRCGVVIRRIAFANRSSHLCPACQRPPRRRRR